MALLTFADGENVLSVDEILTNYILFVVPWVIALVLGFGYVFSWKSSMNTAVLSTQANAYIVKDSLDFREKRDKFLYSKRVKTPKTGGKSAGGLAGAAAVAALARAASKGR